jgi:Family of unknown function (DUF6300)
VNSVQVDASTLRSCHRCEGALLLTAKVPHTIGQAAGSRTIGVCAVCDRDDHALQGVLAFYAFHEHVTDDNAEEALTLIAEWLDHVLTNQTALNQQEEKITMRKSAYLLSGPPSATCPKCSGSGMEIDKHGDSTDCTNCEGSGQVDG